MARMNVAPTKSNLLKVKERLGIAVEGFDLLNRKREILIMELMRYVEEVRILERDIDARVATAYPSLKRMLMACGSERALALSSSVSFEYAVREKTVSVAGMKLPSLEIAPPTARPQFGFLDSFAANDETLTEFFELSRLLARLSGFRAIVFRLAREVKKTQRRVNALEKTVIPDTRDTKAYIESVLEEREREAFFSVKMLKKSREETSL